MYSLLVPTQPYAIMHGQCHGCTGRRNARRMGVSEDDGDPQSGARCFSHSHSALALVSLNLMERQLMRSSKLPYLSWTVSKPDTASWCIVCSAKGRNSTWRRTEAFPLQVCPSAEYFQLREQSVETVTSSGLANCWYVRIWYDISTNHGGMILVERFEVNRIFAHAADLVSKIQI